MNAIINEGGEIIDVGAFSTRPGAKYVTEQEEMERLRYGLQIVYREQPDAVVSIDTFRPEVARMAVEEFGADIINDVSGGNINGAFGGADSAVTKDDDYPDRRIYNRIVKYRCCTDLFYCLWNFHAAQSR